MTTTIVIPYFDDETRYHQREFIDETITSVLAQTIQDFEIIIVNDGSCEEGTRALDRWRAYSNIKVIDKPQNEGLAMARNTGIEAAETRYVLPLDSGDKITSDYLEKTVPILEENPEIGIVYTDVRYFGAINQTWVLPDYNFELLPYQNIITCCALMRKIVWESVKRFNGYGYNPNMVYGWEDWEFWISCGELGWDGYHLSEPLFLYRKTGNKSMIDQANAHRVELFAQIIENHPQLYGRLHPEWQPTRSPIGDSKIVIQSEPHIRVLKYIGQIPSTAIFNFREKKVMPGEYYEFPEKEAYQLIEEQPDRWLMPPHILS